MVGNLLNTSDLSPHSTETAIRNADLFFIFFTPILYHVYQTRGRWVISNWTQLQLTNFTLHDILAQALKTGRLWCVFQTVSLYLIIVPKQGKWNGISEPHDTNIFFKLYLYPHVLQCSVSCGKGKRARYVSCRDAQGGVADESHCAHLPRPPESSACFSPCGQWRAGEWSPVS